MNLYGIQKLTLLDYPGRVACTLFTGGCNFRCPFCQNEDLVFLPEGVAPLSTQEILDYLKKRVGLLEGVCVSGGEPLVHRDLGVLLTALKEMGYAVKLDTNGSYPTLLKQVVGEGLVDYVAMDIKNSLDRYDETAGTPVDRSAVRESAEFLMTGEIPYEFRTTVVKEFHSQADFLAIGQWLEGARAYFLQNFVPSDHVIQPGLHSCTKAELESFVDTVRPFIPGTSIRGV